MNEYSAADLRKTVWGNITELDDGRWETVWHLEFPTSQERTVVEVYRDDGIGFCATLQVTGDRVGELRVLTREQAMSAEYYSPTFTCFGIVNDSLAEIGTIQGLPKDWYAPFRQRTTP
ncbi:hypothetical protein [Nocardia brasiliensis]|uniref:hypothetical protein n=1 Tax=Nocardia brasiliensis TaxID=37326 RepID=UPI00366BFB41